MGKAAFVKYYKIYADIRKNRGWNIILNIFWDSPSPITLLNQISIEWNWRPASLLKRDSNTGVFLWNSRKILRTRTLKNICERVLLSRIFILSISTDCVSMIFTLFRKLIFDHLMSNIHNMAKKALKILQQLLQDF